MSFAWQHHRSRFWTGGYRDEKGKWRRYATKETTRAGAQRQAAKREEIARQARERKWSRAAYRQECQRGEELLFGKDHVGTARQYFNGWLHSRSLDTAEATATRYAGSVKHFLDFLAVRADQPLASLEPSDCRKYHEHLLTIKLAPATRVVEIKTLRTIFNAARREQLILHNPAESVALPRKIVQVKRKTFTPEEVEIVLREVGERDEWAAVILFGYYAAMRLGDAKSRQWDDVDFAAHKLIFRVHKTGEALQIPMHDRLEEHLTAIAGDAIGPICPTLSQIPVGGRNGLSQKFLSLMRRAGLSSESVATGGQRQLATLSFHSLRKSFNSWLRNEGVSQETRKDLTGHKSDRDNDRYTETKLETLRAAVKRLPKLKRLSKLETSDRDQLALPLV